MELIYFISAVIGIVNLILFWRLCSDVRQLKNTFVKPETKSVIVKTPVNSNKIAPSKSDVMEFQSKVKQIKKGNKDETLVQTLIGVLISDYNRRFSEDFAQYLDVHF